jgi:nitrite reductase/ring-hydroxylating ferredoxin subunit
MIKIADSEEQLFQKNELHALECAGKKICVARHNEKIFAFQRTCPHAGADMAEGYIDPLGNVVCPLHHYKFSLKNGRNVSGEGYFLQRYPVRIEESGVYVDMKQ